MYLQIELRDNFDTPIAVRRISDIDRKQHVQLIADTIGDLFKQAKL